MLFKRLGKGSFLSYFFGGGKSAPNDVATTHAKASTTPVQGRSSRGLGRSGSNIVWCRLATTPAKASTTHVQGTPGPRTPEPTVSNVAVSNSQEEDWLYCKEGQSLNFQVDPAQQSFQRCRVSSYWYRQVACKLLQCGSGKLHPQVHSWHDC